MQVPILLFCTYLTDLLITLDVELPVGILTNFRILEQVDIVDMTCLSRKN